MIGDYDSVRYECCVVAVGLLCRCNAIAVWLQCDICAIAQVLFWGMGLHWIFLICDGMTQKLWLRAKGVRFGNKKAPEATGSASKQPEVELTSDARGNAAAKASNKVPDKGPKAGSRGKPFKSGWWTEAAKTGTAMV